MKDPKRPPFVLDPMAPLRMMTAFHSAAMEATMSGWSRMLEGQQKLLSGQMIGFWSGPMSLSGPAPEPADEVPAAAARRTARKLPATPAPAPEAETQPAAKTAEAPKPVAAAPAPETVAQSPKPAVAKAPASASNAKPTQPATLAAPRGGKADDLKRIKGIGPKLEAQLQARGYYHYDQIARWSAAELAWADAYLASIKGRASRDDWVGQAQALASGATGA